MTVTPTPAGRPKQPRARRWATACRVAVVLAAAGCAGCAPPTPQGEAGPGGRPQPLALTPAQELAVGRRSYREVMGEFGDRTLPDDAPESRRVRGIMARLIRAADIEPLQREIGLRVRGYRFEWEQHVVRDKQVNAFCLPAGKIVVFTGILDVAANDDQIACVLAHEMAHALAHHASERVARQQSGANILRSLSYDRMQESEADHVGLFLMTFAGYDPGQAAQFWVRMGDATGGRGRPPEFLSDHPGADRRAHDLHGWAPQARAAKEAFDGGRVVPAR